MLNDAWNKLGSQVKHIEGYWMPGGDMSDNFDSFNSALARRLTPEQAAMQTWTGKMAAEKGFTVVTSVGVVGNEGVIHVVFSKPK